MARLRLLVVVLALGRVSLEADAGRLQLLAGIRLGTGFQFLGRCTDNRRAPGPRSAAGREMILP